MASSHDATGMLHVTLPSLSVSDGHCIQTVFLLIAGQPAESR